MSNMYFVLIKFTDSEMLCRSIQPNKLWKTGAIKILNTKLLRGALKNVNNFQENSRGGSFF